MAPEDFLIPFLLVFLNLNFQNKSDFISLLTKFRAVIYTDLHSDLQSVPILCLVECRYKYYFRTIHSSITSRSRTLSKSQWIL